MPERTDWKNSDTKGKDTFTRLSSPFLDALAAAGGEEALLLELVKDHGETRLAGQGALDEPSWHWPAR